MLILSLYVETYLQDDHHAYVEDVSATMSCFAYEYLTVFTKRKNLGRSTCLKHSWSLPSGSLLMEGEDIPFEELLCLASTKRYWKALVACLWHYPEQLYCSSAHKRCSTLLYCCILYVCIFDVEYNVLYRTVR